jgi:hypothetical protein
LFCCYNGVMAQPKPRTSQQLVRMFIVIFVLLFVSLGIVWWRYVYSDPQQVFNGMINNSMRLRGVSKEVTQDEDGQSVEQVIQMQYGAETRVQSLTRLTQGADDPTVVVTQSIGTPTTDYTRYVSVDTNQTKPDGKPLDFTNILGVWASSKAAAEDTVTNGQLYDETLLGVIPFGVVDQNKRQQVTDMIHKENVYEVDYKNVGRSIENHRPTYTYQVTVDAQAYVKMLKQFGEATGLNHLDDLDPAAYAGSERLPFTIVVDVWSREVKQIVYGNGGRTENYSGYNAVKPIALPEHPITVEDLQNRLQELQQ